MSLHSMRIALILLCVTVFSNCGYHPGAGPLSPTAFGTVAVPIFVNESSEPNIQTVITRAVIREFNRAGVLVVEKPRADKILEGRIVGYSNGSVSRTAASTVSEYRLSVIVQLTLKNREGKILFRHPSAQLREEYFASSILEQNEQAEAKALKSGAVDFAEDVVRHLLDQVNEGLSNENL
ncbi:MAG: LptE family protein [Deltaproteobacteria bacterium]|nr:LptE family protein [Deltaproteobacteria bacterium]